MSKEIILQSGIVAQRAIYKEQLIEEFKGNPLIESLPNLISKDEIVKQLVFKPNIKKQELALPKELKTTILSRIYKTFQPLPIHLEIWDMINSLIRQGYTQRNPFNPNYRKYINSVGKDIVNKNYKLSTNENFLMTSKCGLIIGVSGMGKTTTVHRVLESIPQVIVHNEYKGINFTQIQVPYLKLEAPANSSIKALTLQFFHKLDQLLGTNNVDRYVSKHLSTDALLPIMGQVANSVSLGLLIIDEIQHLDKNFKQIMNYFVTLMNSFGVPLLLIGTPSAYDMFQQELRIARRMSGSGAIIFNRMKNDREFEIFLKAIWKYQWLDTKTKLNKDIIDIFYEKTQGISDLIVKLFVNTQKRAINKNITQITPELIEKVWQDEFIMVQPMLKAIKSKNKVKEVIYNDIREISIENKNVQNYEHKLIENKNIDNKVNYSLDNHEVMKPLKIKVDELDEYDVRKIVINGKKQGLSAYESLNNRGMIVDLDYILGENCV